MLPRVAHFQLSSRMCGRGFRIRFVTRQQANRCHHVAKMGVSRYRLQRQQTTLHSDKYGSV
jgi:hypothetical protein